MQLLNRERPTEEINKKRQHTCNSLFFFKGNPTERMFRKRMIEIWAVSAQFNAISKRLADQARMILMKGWFSDLEIIEIYQQVKREEYQQNLIYIETLNAEKQEAPNRIETQNKEKRKFTHPSNTKMLTQEVKINQKLVKKS